jgi:hypothetical protein
VASRRDFFPAHSPLRSASRWPKSGLKWSPHRQISASAEPPYASGRMALVRQHTYASSGRPYPSRLEQYTRYIAYDTPRST